ncbi:hypothetical protein [Serinibacter arcticus]|uniref:hypothetical protein n=1 Tax=Serinibacter arcticus TaxID=1655435 RepID=UPI001C100350|nr:hypothetical protein [Serinibacter arcticus]
MALLLTACTGAVDLEADPATEVAIGAATQAPADEAVLIEGSTPATLALGASRTYFARAGIVVIAPSGDDAAQLRAASIAMVLGLPTLVMGEEGTQDAVVAELERLGTHTVLVLAGADVPELSPDLPFLRAVPAPEDPAALQVVIGRDIAGEVPVPAGTEVAALASAQPPFDWLLTAAGTEASDPTSDASPTDLADLPGLPPFRTPVRLTNNALVSDGGAGQVAALGTARAAGASVVITSDLREDSAAIAALFGIAPTHVVGIGAFGDPQEFSYRARVAATGVELPGGGQSLLDGKVYVGLRGSAGAPELGSLGEQGVEETMDRLLALGSTTASSSTVVPTAMLLTTVASATPGTDGSYSGKRTVEDLLPFVEAARDSGVSVLLTFQPGRQSMLEQVELYDELLRFPNVGVALEPGWRLAPGEVPGTQSGVVAADEINAVVERLATLTTEAALPPKMLAVRLATTSTVSNPQDIDATRPQVQVVLEVNGGAVTAPVEEAAPLPDGTLPPAAPVVTAADIWAQATAVPWGSGEGLGWWGWAQGPVQVSTPELFGLDPSPVLVVYP